MSEEETCILIEGKAMRIEDYLNRYFPIVRASLLFLEDPFLRHQPESNKQRVFKEELLEVIKTGIPDFRAQVMDPSLDEEDRIFYQKGNKPAVGKSAAWWEENAKKFIPQKKSRIGKRKQRIAFLGVLIKQLIEELGYNASDAWRAVCDQSKELGHFLDSKDAKKQFEPTGSRQVGTWYDLGNTFNLIRGEVFKFVLYGGCYSDNGNDYPLAFYEGFDYPEGEYMLSTAWIVTEV